MLLRTITPWPGTARPALHQLTENGTTYDLYEPAGRSRQTFILLYGLDMAGEQDARLIRLARAFVGSGFRVAIPSLPGLKSLSFDRGDKRAVADLVTHLHEKHGDQIDPLLLFGPYYSLSDLWTTWQACDTPASNRAKDWDCFLWTQMVSAFRNRDSLGLPSAEERELVDLLQNYCTGTSLRRKREFHERVLQSRNIQSRKDAPPDQRTLEDLSPQGHMHHVTSRVLILHDSTDRLISPDHSQRILAELREPDATTLLITPVMSHVSPSSAWRVFDVFRIVRLVGEIFAD